VSAIQPSRTGALVIAWRRFQETKLYDALATVPLILWYGASAKRMLPSLVARIQTAHSSTGGPIVIFAILAQLAALALIALTLVFLVLRRPPKAKAKGLFPRLAALGGTYLTAALVWLPRYEMGFALSLLSLGLILGGTGFAILSMLHLGRSFSVMAEARMLATDGPYAYVRHPLYLGEGVSVLGLMLQYLSPAAIALVALEFALQLVRMRNEEAVLSAFFPGYADYQLQRYRVLPGVY
jgi:protein-S-isoprenylcysteine O-methyltransferase Ste14